MTLEATYIGNEYLDSELHTNVEYFLHLLWSSDNKHLVVEITDGEKTIVTAEYDSYVEFFEEWRGVSKI